jgi:uncharacterized membrane protein
LKKEKELKEKTNIHESKIKFIAFFFVLIFLFHPFISNFETETKKENLTNFLRFIFILSHAVVLGFCQKEIKKNKKNAKYILQSALMELV